MIDLVIRIRDKETCLFPADLMSELSRLCWDLSEETERVNYSDLISNFQPPCDIAYKLIANFSDERDRFFHTVEHWKTNNSPVNNLLFSYALSCVVYLHKEDYRENDDVHYLLLKIEFYLRDWAYPKNW